MEYVSTRNKEIKVSAAKAIATGIAPDGGLYCPTEYPTLTKNEIQALCSQNYKERAAYILGKYLTDFTAEELKEYTEKAYNDEKFGGSNTAPVIKLADGKYILELWHGPTCAFKDMALQILPYLLTSSLKKIGEQRTACILVATSGDTGKAALEGFKNVDGTKIMVYYPVDGVSTIQKLQMATQEGDNVFVCAIQGNFDDAQSAVKKIFTDPQTLKKLDHDGMALSSANSINWGRLAPQIAYYISAYCDLVNTGEIGLGDEVNICVPTGNFGNILAAYFAFKMGLPVHKFICASNKNRVLTDFFENNGIYDKNRDFYVTTSPSMDILISSNLERLLFLASGKNDKKVAEFMHQLNESGHYTLDAEIFNKISEKFIGGFCNDEMAAEAIDRLYHKESYLMDTHTAVAVKVFEDYKVNSGDKIPTIIVSTASPYKFCQSVITAIGGTVSSDGTELLDQLHEMTNTPVPKPLANLKGKSVRFTKIIDKSEILQSTDLLKNI